MTGERLGDMKNIGSSCVGQTCYLADTKWTRQSESSLYESGSYPGYESGSYPGFHDEFKELRRMPWNYM